MFLETSFELEFDVTCDLGTEPRQSEFLKRKALKEFDNSLQSGFGVR